MVSLIKVSVPNVLQQGCIIFYVGQKDYVAASGVVMG